MEYSPWVNERPSRSLVTPCDCHSQSENKTSCADDSPRVNGLLVSLLFQNNRDERKQIALFTQCFQPTNSTRAWLLHVFEHHHVAGEQNVRQRTLHSGTTRMRRSTHPRLTSIRCVQNGRVGTLEQGAPPPPRALRTRELERTPRTRRGTHVQRCNAENNQTPVGH